MEAVIRRRKRSSDRSDVGPPWPASSRSAPTSSRPSWAAQHRPHAQRVRAAPAARRGQGKVLQREEIYQAVWGYATANGDRSVDVFVRKLRQKLETASPDWSYIHTHFGVGYRFEPEGPDGPARWSPFETSLGHQPETPAPPPARKPSVASLARLRHLPEYELATFRRRMSRNQRIGLIVAAVVVAVVAFVIASSSGDDTSQRPANERHHRADRDDRNRQRSHVGARAAAGHEDRHSRWRGGGWPRRDPRQERRHRRDRRQRRRARRHPSPRLRHREEGRALGSRRPSGSRPTSKASSKSRVTWQRTPAVTRCWDPQNQPK